MTNYHLSPKTGKKEICHAEKRECSYKHFTIITAEEAIRTGDMNAYLNAKENNQAEVHITDFTRGDTIEYDDLSEIEVWSLVRSHTDTINLNGIEFAIAPEGKSPYWCLDCGKPLTTDEADKLHATVKASCGHNQYPDLTGTSLQRSQLRLLNKENVLTERWFHTSRHPNWDEKISSPNKDMPYMHLGSLDAALERAHQLNSKENGVYLYEVQLASHTQVEDNMLDEDPFGEKMPKLGDDIAEEKAKKQLLPNGAVRYMNGYEDAGSVSLITDPKIMKVIGKQPLR